MGQYVNPSSIPYSRTSEYVHDFGEKKTTKKKATFASVKFLFLEGKPDGNCLLVIGRDPRCFSQLNIKYQNYFNHTF